MHFVAEDYCLVEIIDPKTLEVLPFEDGVEGEIVYTGLEKECAPLVRWRDKDIVQVFTEPAKSGIPGFASLLTPSRRMPASNLRSARQEQISETERYRSPASRGSTLFVTIRSMSMPLQSGSDPLDTRIRSVRSSTRRRSTDRSAVAHRARIER